MEESWGEIDRDVWQPVVNIMFFPFSFAEDLCFLCRGRCPVWDGPLVFLSEFRQSKVGRQEWQKVDVKGAVAETWTSAFYSKENHASGEALGFYYCEVVVQKYAA